MTVTLFSDTIGMCGVDCLLASCYQDGRCHRCRSEKPHQKRTSKWKCQIRSCVLSRQLNHCGECPDFPCMVRKRLDTTYRRSYKIDLQENCRMLAALGPEAWERQSRERHACPSCGHLIDPYRRTWYRCGKTFP